MPKKAVQSKTTKPVSKTSKKISKASSNLNQPKIVLVENGVPFDIDLGFTDENKNSNKFY